jgi:tetratricopeptide (TPR) repeat protein
MGYIELLQGNYEEAISFFDKALAVNSFFVEALDNKGYAYELKGNYPEAKKIYESVLDINPNYENSLEGLKRIK